MTMKIAILTTDTTHHLYYVWKLAQRYELGAVFLETKALTPPFETGHPFEDLREEYERDVLLEGCASTFDDIVETHRFETVNSDGSISMLKRVAPHVILVFGTGKLLPAVFNSAGIACLNLHGGNPEEYRGLDSHLWAIYHNDFNNIKTSIHVIDGDLDTGDLVGQQELPVGKGNGLHELRSINTKACVSLTLNALNRIDSGDPLGGRKQSKRGRYYSFMPSVLKNVCVRNFDAYVSRLR